MNKHRHFIIHKPPGCLSQLLTNQRKQQKKNLLSGLYDFPKETMVIGRLDYYSEGLLLLTTDGKISNQVRSRNVEKEYLAELDGKISNEAVAKLIQGVMISINGKPYTTMPGRVQVLPHPPDVSPNTNTRVSRHRPTSWISITIREGKYRQVRKMTASVGFPTLRLIRTRIGHIKLSNLPAGNVVEVDDFGFKS